MKDNIPPLLGDKADAAGGCGWLVIGAALILALAAGVSIWLIAEPLWRSWR